VPHNYRSNDNSRLSFIVENENGVNTFSYMSEYSKDSVAVFYDLKNRVVVFAYRGTDTADPNRFLNYIPGDYEETIKSIVFKSPAFKLLDIDSKELVRSEPFGTDLFNTFFSMAEREKFLNAATAKYCAIGISTVKTERPLNARVWNSSLVMTQDITGGVFSAAPNSDCKADNIITKNSVNNLSKYIGATTDIQNETKHNQTWSWTHKILRKLKAPNMTFIFTGHSLGGSLACNSFLNATEDDDLNCVFVAFNAASLFNYNAYRRTIDLLSKRMIHYRFLNDATSQQYGESIPTVNFQAKATDIDIVPKLTEYHGLTVFENRPITDVFETNIKN
jgi:hypothetical protein